MDERIRLLWITLGYRFESLLEGLFLLIDSHNILSAMLLVRAMLEYAALLHYYAWKIVPLYNRLRADEKIQNIVKGKTAGLFVSSELEDLLIKGSHGTRDKELLAVNPKWQAINIMTMIDFLAKNEDFRDARRSYDKLCEYTHPNIGTNTLYVADHLENERVSVLTLRKGPLNYDLFCHECNYPLLISCRIAKEGISSLRKARLTEDVRRL